MFPSQSVHTRQYHWPLSLYLFLLHPLRVRVVWLRSVLCCVDVRDSIYIHKLAYTETPLRPAFWLESQCWSCRAQCVCTPLKEVRVASAPVLIALLHVWKLPFSLFVPAAPPVIAFSYMWYFLISEIRIRYPMNVKIRLKKLKKRLNKRAWFEALRWIMWQDALIVVYKKFTCYCHRPLRFLCEICLRRLVSMSRNLF